jgi:hypothetical protein
VGSGAASAVGTAANSASTYVNNSLGVPGLSL